MYWQSLKFYILNETTWSITRHKLGQFNMILNISNNRAAINNKKQFFSFLTTSLLEILTPCVNITGFWEMILLEIKSKANFLIKLLSMKKFGFIFLDSIPES